MMITMVFTDIIIISMIVVVFVFIIILAQDQEAYGVCYNCDHMDRRVSVSDPSEFFNHSHHWKYLHAVVRIQQFCCGENTLFVIFRYIPVATGGDAVLLLKDCLQTKNQGNYRVVVTV